MAKKLKGPLTLGDEAADTDYNAQMKDLMGQLVQTPEEREKDELLAWGGGLTDPAGAGNIFGALGAGNAAQSKERLEDKKLRAQYIPMIMNALAEQAKASASSAMLQEPLAGMPLERMYNITVATGKDLKPAWELANVDNLQANTYRRRFNKDTGKWDTVFLGKPGDPQIELDPNTLKPLEVSNVPGSATVAGQTAGATSYGKAAGENLASTTPVIGPGGAKGVVPTRVVNPLDVRADLRTFETQPAAATPTVTPSGPVPVPTQGPPTGAPPTGPQAAPTGPATVAPGPAVTAQPPVRPSASAPSTNMRGAWTGTPEEILAQINKFPPQIRDQMRASYANQQSGNNPAQDPNFTPKYDLADMAAGKPPPVDTPVADTPKKNPFVQTELSPGQVQQNENIKASSAAARKTYDELIARSEKSGEEELRLKQLEKGLAGVGKTGPYTTEVRAGLAKVLAAAGIEADEKYLTNYQAVEQAVKTKVNAAIMADKGVATEGDAQRHEKVQASLQGTPKYNEYMLDTYRAVLERDKQKANFYRRMYPKAERSPDGDTGKVERDWAQVQPSLYKMPSMQKWFK